MFKLSQYPGGFNGVLAVRQVPIVNNHAGNVFWVDANAGSPGRGTFKNPDATLNAAIARCTANKGDIIFLKPNHYEDIPDTSSSGAIDLDVAGISVIGIGNGTNQPRFDFNHADSDFIIGANNILVDNVNFEATVTGVKIGVAIEAAVTGSIIRNCKFSVETTTTDEFLVGISLLAGCDNTIIANNHMDAGLGGAVSAIKLTGASSNVQIIENLICGDYSTANINGITAASLEVLIKDNVLMNGGSGNVGTEPLIEMYTGTTGYVLGNDLFCNVATVAAMTVADTMFFSRNYASEDVGAAAGAVLRTGAASVTAMADD